MPDTADTLNADSIAELGRIRSRRRRSAPPRPDAHTPGCGLGADPARRAGHLWAKEMPTYHYRPSASSARRIVPPAGALRLRDGGTRDEPRP